MDDYYYWLHIDSQNYLLKNREDGGDWAGGEVTGNLPHRSWLKNAFKISTGVIKIREKLKFLF